MAWSDKPTKAQINAVWSLTKWALPTSLGDAAIRYLELHATRKEVSDELGRLRDLRIDRRLRTKEDVFSGEIWKDFKYD